METEPKTKMLRIDPIEELLKTNLRMGLMSERVATQIRMLVAHGRRKSQEAGSDNAR